MAGLAFESSFASVEGVDDEDAAIRSALRFVRDIGTGKLRLETLSVVCCNFASLRVTFGLVLLLLQFPLLERFIGSSGVFFLDSAE